MKREILIAFIIIILIVILNIITANYTNKSMEDITSDLDKIRIQLVSKNKENLNDSIDNVIKKWEEKKNILAFYIEHTELEKMELYLHELDSNVETDEFNIAIQSLDSCNFMASHIRDKYEVALKNIF